MTRLWRRGLPYCLLGLLLAGAALELRAWLARNGLPDGYQNEYLHVGNALDLWESAGRRDTWTLRYQLTQNYWPPGFYVWPWPLFSAFGATHEALVLGNLGHYAILLWAVYQLAALMGGRGAGVLAMLLVAVYPAVFGNLMRYEPSVANLAWVALSSWLLVQSQGLTRLGPSALCGLACGLGLLMDRLTLGVFLGPVIALELLRSWRDPVTRGPATRGALALGLTALVGGGWWVLSFLWHNAEEVLSQTTTGEIDSAGALTESRSFATNLLYYPLTLLDGQAGLVPGLLGILVLILGAKTASPGPEAQRARRVLLGQLVLGLALFTLIQKKQVYYTTPLLAAVAVFSAQPLVAWRWGRTLALGVLLLGLHQRGLRLWGEGLPLPAVLGEPALPLAWVEPRHPQALPPRELSAPWAQIASAVGGRDLIVFSDDQTWYEGFVVLRLREQLPGRKVRGLISDPQGVYEWLGVTDVVLTVDPADQGWPGTARLEAALGQHHYVLEDLPPVVEALVEARGSFGEVARWELEGGLVLRVWRRG